MKRMAVLLDRDGVINASPDRYVTRWEQFSFLPGSLEALRRLHLFGLAVIVVSNQSCIGRGLVAAGTVEDIHRRMRRAVADAGGNISEVFVCPHAPDDGCSCRKPKPGLMIRAFQRFGLDGAHTVMVGDSLGDLLCARAAGCGGFVLVRTGHGAGTEKEMAAAGVRADFIADDLRAAAWWITDLWVNSLAPGVPGMSSNRSDHTPRALPPGVGAGSENRKRRCTGSRRRFPGA